MELRRLRSRIFGLLFAIGLVWIIRRSRVSLSERLHSFQPQSSVKFSPVSTMSGLKASKMFQPIVVGNCKVRRWFQSLPRYPTTSDGLIDALHCPLPHSCTTQIASAPCGHGSYVLVLQRLLAILRFCAQLDSFSPPPTGSTALTRFRADENHVHQQVAVQYYEQRASVPGTLLVTEGTFISVDAGGYDNVPGIWNKAQIDAWKKVSSGTC